MDILASYKLYTRALCIMYDDAKILFYINN